MSSGFELTAPLIKVRDKPVSKDVPGRDARVAHAAFAELGGRVSRGQFFKASLFGDPAWDILLELFTAEMDGSRIQVSAIGIRTNVRPTTVLRWLAALEAEKLIRRERDPLDARRVFISLTDHGSHLMTAYFEHQLDDVISRQRVAGTQANWAAKSSPRIAM